MLDSSVVARGQIRRLKKIVVAGVQIVDIFRSDSLTKSNVGGYNKPP